MSRKQKASKTLFRISVVACLLLYLFDGGPYNPTDKNAKCFSDEDSFFFDSLNKSSPAVMVKLGYRGILKYPPQYVFPLLMVQFSSNFGQSNHTYQSFRNMSVGEGFVVFSVNNQITGSNVISIFLCGKLMHYETIDSSLSTYIHGTSILMGNQLSTSLHNVCIENNTIAFFSPYDLKISDNSHILHMPFSVFYLSMFGYARLRKSPIAQNKSYAILSCSAQDVVRALNHIPIENGTKVFVRECSNISSILKPNHVNFINFTQPLCFENLEMTPISTMSSLETKHMKSLIKEKEINDTKIVIDSRFANHFLSAQSLNVDGNITTVYAALSNAKVFIGAGQKSSILTFLMNNEETAFIDVSTCSYKSEVNIFSSKPKYFRMTPNNMQKFDCREENNGKLIDWKAVRKLASDICDNNDDSPLLD